MLAERVCLIFIPRNACFLMVSLSTAPNLAISRESIDTGAELSLSSCCVFPVGVGFV